MPSLTIDGTQATVESGSTVLDAAKKLGIEIPTLCHHEHLLPYGACRLCTVEITQRGATRLQAACAYPAEEGISVRTNSSRILKGRKLMMHFLLSRCPDVPAVRKKAAEFGITRPRFAPKNEKCILCGMCVRVCNEVLGASAIGFADRGIFRRVEPAFAQPSEACLGCGACTFVCPTGHIQMESQTRDFWRDKLGAEQRQCRYARMGLVAHKVCPRSFQCQKCEVDQAMEETLKTHPAFVARPVERKLPVTIEEFTVMPQLYFAKNHLWLKRLDGKVKVGIDDFARKVISRVDDIVMPSAGDTLSRGEAVWELRSGGRTLSLRTPLGGRLIDVNTDLLTDPSLATKDPYYRGWLALVWPREEEWRETAGRLQSGRAAEDWFASEAERLYHWSEPAGKAMAADGGRLIPDLPGKLSETQWKALTGAFFADV
ncbi:MAG: 2Fe-2S iron-sulfur cluster-binding protein [Planctomycetota bacterium]|nr:2Fe-2S iron-sulfur cluster-binding protein [Planctomycetota bacterium]